MMALLLMLGCSSPAQFNAGIGVEGPQCGTASGLPTSCGGSRPCIDPEKNLCESEAAVYGMRCEPGQPEYFSPPDPCGGCYPPASPCGGGWCQYQSLCTEDNQCRLVTSNTCGVGIEVEAQDLVFGSPTCPESCRPVD